MANIMKKNNLLDACLNNNGDIFDEMKKLRSTAPTVAPTIANTYEKLMTN